MQTYVLIALIAYLMFALNGVIDKFLLKRGIPEPVSFAFYIGILSGLSILLAPFGFHMASGKIVGVALVSGVSFLYALVAMYESLRSNEASTVLPTVGAIAPAATLAFSAVLVGERLNGPEFVGMCFLVLGSSFMLKKLRGHASSEWFVWAGLSGVLFAFSFTLAKLVYEDQGFISGLIWTRLGLVAGALSLLVLPKLRREILDRTKQVARPTGTLFITGQVIGAGAGILQNYAVSIGSVTIVNALQGTQFGFLFLLTGFLSYFYPKVLREDVSHMAIIRKILAIVLIGIGLLFLSIV